MGSRRTNQQREERLREAGVDDAGIARLHTPIGLDIGARTPEETAVSVCAEIISARNASVVMCGRSARPTARSTAATSPTDRARAA